MTWQPIETAPKDGTEIMFCRAGSYEYRLGYYSEGHIYTGGLVKMPSAIPREWADIATHWMPLPPPPEVET